MARLCEINNPTDYTQKNIKSCKLLQVSTEVILDQ